MSMDSRLLIENIPSLKGAQLCPFLQAMNDAEKAAQGPEQQAYEKAKQDQKFYSKIFSSFGGFATSSLLSTVVLKIKMGAEKAWLDELDILSSIARLSSVVFSNGSSQTVGKNIADAWNWEQTVSKLERMSARAQINYDVYNGFILPLIGLSAVLSIGAAFFFYKGNKVNIPTYNEARWVRLDAQLKQIKDQISKSEGAEKEQLGKARSGLKYNKILFVAKQ